MNTMRYLRLLLILFCNLAVCGIADATTYYVDQSALAASDQNAGTAAKPWKTINRAAGAAEVMPGDTVLIKSGVYREGVVITRSGTPDKPINFGAAPDERVVIKGSTTLTGAWTRVTGDPNIKEPYPNAFATVWKMHLDDSYFQGLAPNARYISSVFVSDTISLQQIGKDAIYADPNILSPIGKDLSNIFLNSFYFDQASQTLYIDINGDPSWFSIEVGTSPFPFIVSQVHDVNISGLQVRHNRQPSSQWSMAGLDRCERVNVSDCTFTHSDFCGLSVGFSKNCKITRCIISFNGDVGFSFHKSSDCTVDGCLINNNNTRHFNSGWHAGGMKNIPGNIRCTVQNCEVAYNNGAGIWFDDGNEDCRIIHNVSHHNEVGIFYEINPGGGLIADNLIFSSSNRGIYISGSQGVKIVNNTVAQNDTGVVIMPREAPFKSGNNLVQNNLFLHNVIAKQTLSGADMTLFMDADANGKRTLMTHHSKSNLYATGLGMPALRAEWNNNIPLAVWQKTFGEDLTSKATSFSYRVFGDTFKITDPQAATKRAIATPLPAGLSWKPQNPKLVGSSITVWPTTKW